MLKAKGFLFSLALGTTLSFASQNLNAQLHSLSNLHISESSSFSIQGKYSFADGNGFVKPGVISTAKTGAKGFVNFVQGSSWTGATTKQFVNGYVQVGHNNPFVFPIGSNQQYRPVAITGGAMTSAAFFDRNPAKIKAQFKAKVPSAVSELLVIKGLSEKGYWEVNGATPTFMTFTWGIESKIDELTEGELNNLSVLGWRDGQWEVIPSTVDKYALDNSSHELLAGKQLSNAISGSITTNGEVNPDDYSYFTLGAINAPAEVVDAVPTGFSVYPNPSLTRLPLNVKYQLADVSGGTLQVFSATGALLAERVLEVDHGVVTLANITDVAGTYTISITDNQGETLTKKLMVVSE